MFLVVLCVSSLLALKFPFTNPLNILEKPEKLDSGAEYVPNEAATKQQGSSLMPPPFLLKIYHDRKESADFKVHSLESLQAERDQNPGEFFVMPWRMANTRKLKNAAIYISTLEMLSIVNKQTPKVSVYEANGATKVSSRPLSAKKSGWISLPVTMMIKKWIGHGNHPLRFRISVERNVGEDRELMSDFMWNITTPWLVMNMKIVDEQPSFLSALRIPTDVDRRESSKERFRRQVVTETKKPENSASCSKVDMVINTTAVGWSGWLIRPKTFNAYQCEGKCSKSVQKSYVNHAFLKALVHQTQGEGPVLEQSCCVATKMKPITFLYFNKEHHIVLQSFNDMVVEKCGCY